MNSMGGSCSSVNGQRDLQNQRCARECGNFSVSRELKKYSRHSVISALPDGSIAHLYPLDKNYVKSKDGTRSPKSLSELCTDALCRSLPYMNGELPSGLPQDVVDDVVSSLVKHNALNATALRILRNCELGSLTLSGCRGVTDEWLEAFDSQRSSSTAGSPRGSYELPELVPESMDLDSRDNNLSEVFYNTSHEHPSHHEESSCSTASFVSATSFPCMTNYSMAEMDLQKGRSDSMYWEEQGYSSSSFASNMTLLDLRGSQQLTDKGLMKLSDLHRLEVARLDNCYSILGRGLMALSMSHRLHTLSLANCRRLTDDAILAISHLKSLEALSLDGCRCITDRSLAALSGLYRLKKLDLSQCDLITDDGLEGLESLEELEQLSLGWCRLISDNGLETLSRQNGRSKTLRILSLARCPITDSGVIYLARFRALEELDLNGCSHIGSGALGSALAKMNNLQGLDVSYCPGIVRSSWQGKIPALQRLDLCYSAVRDSHMAKLTDLPNLQELSLDSCLVGDWSLAHLVDNNVVPNLTSLDLADTELTDLGMVHVGKFSKLKRLSLFYCNISHGGLRHLSSLQDLEVLNLDSREIGDEGLYYLRNLKLKSLDIFSGRITDSGCSHVAKISSLESLELCGGGIGDLGCSILAAGLPHLRSLNLSQNERITNRGAASLACLVHLKTLNLSNTRVTATALNYFCHLSQLQSLALYGCRGVSEHSRSLVRLQNELPGLRCVRLNTLGTEEDGMIRRPGDADEETTDEETFEDEEDQYGYDYHAEGSMLLTTTARPFHDDESSEESDNDEMDVAEDNPSFSSSDGDDESVFSSSSSFSDHD